MSNPCHQLKVMKAEKIYGGKDESMASEEDDAEKAKSKSATSRQNEELYAVAGEGSGGVPMSGIEVDE
ncbi:hypothetical protein CRYUN_Cryun01aG0149200 [Craigia yunnanensis]